jgi:hypothetical protein
MDIKRECRSTFESSVNQNQHTIIYQHF